MQSAIATELAPPVCGDRSVIKSRVS